MRISSLMLALCASALLITGGCAKNQMAAKKSVDKIEESLKDVRADAERYAPEGLKSIDSQVARFKADIDAKNYDDVVAGTPSLEKAVDSLKDAVALGKKHAAQALEVAKTEWTALSEEVPKMVQAIENRVDSLSGSRLPKDVNKESFEAAKVGLQSMKALWAEASAAFDAGNAVLAADKARMVQAKGEEVIGQLGMSPV